MNVPGESEPHAMGLLQRIMARVGAHDTSVIGDLTFLRAWEAGRVPWLSGAMRMRQIRRANPVVVVPEDMDTA